jgi:hypothetical protein
MAKIKENNFDQEAIFAEWQCSYLLQKKKFFFYLDTWTGSI